MPYKDPKKRKEAFKKYYEKNKEKVLEKNRKWAADNPDRAREIDKASHRRLRGDAPIIKDHEGIEEALGDLFPEPEPKPEAKPKPKREKKPYPLSDEEVAEMLKDLKQ